MTNPTYPTKQDLVSQLMKVKTAIHQTYDIPYSNKQLVRMNTVCDGWDNLTAKQIQNQLDLVRINLHADYGVDIDSNESGLISDVMVLVDLAKKYSN